MAPKKKLTESPLCHQWALRRPVLQLCSLAPMLAGVSQAVGRLWKASHEQPLYKFLEMSREVLKMCQEGQKVGGMTFYDHTHTGRYLTRPPKDSSVVWGSEPCLTCRFLRLEVRH